MPLGALVDLLLGKGLLRHVFEQFLDPRDAVVGGIEITCGKDLAQDLEHLPDLGHAVLIDGWGLDHLIVAAFDGLHPLGKFGVFRVGTGLGEGVALFGCAAQLFQHLTEDVVHFAALRFDKVFVLLEHLADLPDPREKLFPRVLLFGRVKPHDPFDQLFPLGKRRVFRRRVCRGRGGSGIDAVAQIGELRQKRVFLAIFKKIVVFDLSFDHTDCAADAVAGSVLFGVGRCLEFVHRRGELGDLGLESLKPSLVQQGGAAAVLHRIHIGVVVKLDACAAHDHLDADLGMKLGRALGGLGQTGRGFVFEFEDVFA